MSNATEMDRIGKMLMRQNSQELQAAGKLLQGMMTEVRRDELVAGFVRSEGGEDAVADILIHAEAKRLREEHVARERASLAIPPFPGNVVALPTPLNLARFDGAMA